MHGLRMLDDRQVGRRKRLPHKWDRRFRLSTRRSNLALALLAERRPDGALERPRSDVIDLLVHGARERDDLHGGADEILLAHRPACEPRLGQGRYHTLLDLGSSPPNRELRQLREGERAISTPRRRR